MFLLSQFYAVAKKSIVDSETYISGFKLYHTSMQQRNKKIPVSTSKREGEEHEGKDGNNIGNTGGKKIEFELEEVTDFIMRTGWVIG